VNPRVTLATAARVLLQVRHDPRTLVMIVVVPCVLLAVIKGAFTGQAGTFDRIGGPLVGLFPLILMFLITSITMLRERTTGTLERLMTLPLAKLDLLGGYGLAFALVAAVQASIVAAFAFLVLELDTAGSPALVVMLAIANALLGMALGLFTSAFARTEFQAVQFLPAFIFPQLLLCGLFVARDKMSGLLEAISWALPMTYAYDALESVSTDGSLGGDGLVDLGVTLSATVLALVAGAMTLRRRTA
jgi:ABC-2 type transport system permease protein